MGICFYLELTEVWYQKDVFCLTCFIFVCLERRVQQDAAVFK
jgi:hypothetical protein